MNRDSEFLFVWLYSCWLFNEKFTLSFPKVNHYLELKVTLSFFLKRMINNFNNLGMNHLVIVKIVDCLVNRPLTNAEWLKCLETD